MHRLEWKVSPQGLLESGSSRTATRALIVQLRRSTLRTLTEIENHDAALRLLFLLGRYFRMGIKGVER